MHITLKPSRRAATENLVEAYFQPAPGSLADIRQILRDMSFDEVMCGITYIGIMGVLLLVLALFG